MMIEIAGGYNVTQVDISHAPTHDILRGALVGGRWEGRMDSIACRCGCMIFKCSIMRRIA